MDQDKKTNYETWRAEQLKCPEVRMSYEEEMEMLRQLFADTGAPKEYV